jgi:nucleoid DNA-binding protein
MAGIGDVARAGGIKPDDVKKTFAAILGLLKSGEKITIAGIGTFKLKDKNARKARNPQTGESIDVPAKTVPFLQWKNEVKKEVDEARNPKKVAKKPAAPAAAAKKPVKPGDKKKIKK